MRSPLLCRLGVVDRLAEATLVAIAAADRTAAFRGLELLGNRFDLFSAASIQQESAQRDQTCRKVLKVAYLVPFMWPIVRCAKTAR